MLSRYPSLSIRITPLLLSAIRAQCQAKLHRLIITVKIRAECAESCYTPEKAVWTEGSLVKKRLTPSLEREALPGV